MSSISRKDMSGDMSSVLYSTNWPGVSLFFWRQMRNVRFIYLSNSFLTLLVAPLRQMDFFVDQRFFVQDRLSIQSLILPRRDIREVLVVAHRFAVRSLVLFA